jgi:HEAT repeat protein
MDNTFETKLQKVIDTTPAELRDRIVQDIEELRAAGVDSFGALVATLQDPTVAMVMRLSACWLLGRLGDKRALVPLLAASEAELVWEAAKALAVINDKRAVVPLISSLLEGKDIEQQAAAAYALGLLGDKLSVEPLLETLGNRNVHPKVRGHAAEALAHSGDDHAVDSLITALGDPSAEVRFWASFALGQLGNKKALPDLERLLSEVAILPRWGKVSDAAREAIKNIEARSSRDG